VFVILSGRGNRQRKPPNTAYPGRQRWGMSNMIGPYAISTLFLCIALCVLELLVLRDARGGSYLSFRGYGDGAMSRERGIRASTSPTTGAINHFSLLPTHVHDSLRGLIAFQFTFRVVFQLSMAIYIPYYVDTPSHSHLPTLSPSPVLSLTNHMSEVKDAILAPGHLKRPISFLDDTPHDLCTTIPTP
jgi:hypothetical protein